MGETVWMNLPVTAQMVQFGCAVALGFCLALFWSFLRALRTESPRLVHLCDGLFGLVLLPTLLLFALYVGDGRFRLFFFPGIALGCACFFLLLGSLSQRVFRVFWGTIRAVIQFIRKFSQKFAKKLFSFQKK